jgi:broad specificity phosphatase PhoE
MTLAPSETRPKRVGAVERRVRIVLVRHGKPAIATNPRTCHRGFRTYIDAYQDARLDPGSLPPAELVALVSGSDWVFTSPAPRATDSARRLLPEAELIADPLFEEAPLASPCIPLLKMKVPAWAVMARVLWHAGYHPEIETYKRARLRAAEAAEILLGRAAKDSGVAVLVAHGYFNAMIGRVLRKRGLRRSGMHRAAFWNAVVYEHA